MLGRDQYSMNGMFGEKIAPIDREKVISCRLANFLVCFILILLIIMIKKCCFEFFL